MKAIELVGDIDERHRLQAHVPADLPAGPVRLIVLLPDEDDGGGAWGQGVAKEWAADLQDSREDLYALEDGQPVNAPGEIFLAQFPFGDLPGMKLRRVLLLTEPIGSVPEVLVAYISSVIPAQALPSDVLLDPGKPEFRSTNLKAKSALRLHKLATIHSSSLARYLGTIDPSTQSAVASKLRDLLKL